MTLPIAKLAGKSVKRRDRIFSKSVESPSASGRTLHSGNLRSKEELVAIAKEVGAAGGISA